MSVNKIKLVLAFSLCCLVQNSSLAEEISIATGEFPPLYTETTENNGIVLQLVKEALAAVGIQTKIQFLPWARANLYAKNGETDASCCWFEQEERAKFATYSEPVFPYTYSFFHLKSTPFDWKTIDDLRGLQLGGTESYTYTREFTQAEKDKVINVQRTSSDLANLKMLLAGRIDAFPLNVDVGYFTLKHQFSPQEAASVTHHPTPLVNAYVHLLFPKKKAKSERLLKAFNRGLRIIKDNGRYQQLIDEYNKSKKG